MEEIKNAVLAFINAETWSESKRIVEQHQDVLLTDVADQVFASLLAHYTEDANATHTLTAHRAILRQARNEGIDAAFAERVNPTRVDIPTELLARLQQVQTEEEMTQLLEDHPELVPILEQLMQQQTQSPDVVLARILQEWITTNTWSTKQAYLSENQNVLLTDAAEAALERLIQVAEQQNDTNALHIFTTHHAILHQARSEGIDAAFSEHVQPAQAAPQAAPQPFGSGLSGLESLPPELLTRLQQVETEEEMQQLLEEHPELVSILEQIQQTIMQESLVMVGEAIQAWVTAETWESSKTYLSEHQDILLNDTAEAALEHMIQRFQENNDANATRILASHQTLLRQARSEGIDAAFAEVLSRPYDTQTNQAVLAFINANNWSASKGIVEQHQAVLLTDEADQVFADLLLQYTGNEQAIRTLTTHRAILHQARSEGIDAAFAETEQ